MEVQRSPIGSNARASGFREPVGPEPIAEQADEPEEVIRGLESKHRQNRAFVER